MVYRSGVNDFEKIASLGPNNSSSFTYDDTLVNSGQVQYYVSVFNSAGESPSNIVSVQAPVGTCGPAMNPLVKYENGSLVVGNGMDLAYVYASLDKADWQRLPEGDGFFTPQNGRVDLLQYLDPLLKVKPFARQVDLQIWGWSGGAIRDLGPLTVTFDHSSLIYCDQPPGGCSGDVGSTYWNEQGGVISSNSPGASPGRDFRFFTNSPGAPYGLVQVSLQPFSPEYQPEPAYLVEAFLVNVTSSSTVGRADFKIDFSNLKPPQANSNFIFPQTNWWNVLNPNPAPAFSPFSQSLLEQMNQNAFAPALLDSFLTTTYYIRVMPWDVDTPMGVASNAIAVSYKPTDQSTIPIIADQPSLFSIQMVGFSPEEQIDPDLFGCVTITALDEAKYRAWLQANYINQLQPLAEWYAKMGFDIGPFMDANGNPIDAQTWVQQRIAEVQNQIASQKPVCPERYVPEEGSSVWSDLWDAVSSTWNAIVELYNGLKNGIVDAFATVLNGIAPGICGSDCRSGLMTGLNVAITYFTGIPPNLPTTDELVDKGLSLAIDAALDEAGIGFCDELCKGQLKDAIKAQAESLKQTKSQPACFGGSNTAWYGKKPMCLPDGLITEPIHGGAYRPPNVKVQITRNQQGIIYSAAQYDYTLLVTSTLVNGALVGQNYMCPGNGFGYVNGNFALGYWPLPVPEGASGDVYLDESIPLPGDLTPGTQFDLPITLKAPKVSPYLYPPYQALIGQPKGLPSEERARHCSYRLLTSPGYTITLQAQLMCTSQQTGQVIPCPPTDIAITSDTKQYTP